MDDDLDDLTPCLACKRLIEDHNATELERCLDILDGFLAMLDADAAPWN